LPLEAPNVAQVVLQGGGDGEAVEPAVAVEQGLLLGARVVEEEGGCVDGALEVDQEGQSRLEVVGEEADGLGADFRLAVVEFTLLEVVEGTEGDLHRVVDGFLLGFDQVLGDLGAQIVALIEAVRFVDAEPGDTDEAKGEAKGEAEGDEEGTGHGYAPGMRM